ncbi:MAG: type II secretion system protein [Candidatus Aureabacteria bacterium]|nr:type II secretion system protein [Candidatus Auribacterota bacterium]
MQTKKTMKKRAFTLIEILVVMVILVILAGLALTSYKSAKQKAQNAQCISNIKSLHEAMMVYLSERSAVNEKNPPVITDLFLKQYLGTTRNKIRCPMLPEGSFGYAVNSNLLNGSNELKALIEHIPNTMILLYEVAQDGNTVPASRHNGKSYAVNVLGEILLGFDPTSEDYIATGL